MLAEAHEYHGPSLALFVNGHDAQFAVAAHSYTEAYNTLARRGKRAPFQFTLDEAWAAPRLRLVAAAEAMRADTTPKRGEIDATLHGERGNVLAWIQAQNAKNPTKTKTPAALATGVLLSVGAGTRTGHNPNNRLTVRLSA